MSLIDERVSDVMQRHGGIASSDVIQALVNKRWPPGVNNDAIAASLRRLVLQDVVEVAGKGSWRLTGRKAVAPPAPARSFLPPTEKPKTAPKIPKCGKCGSTDLTKNDTCRPCKKQENKEYQARYQAKRKAERAALAALVPKVEVNNETVVADVNTPRPDETTSRFVEPILMLMVVDVDGEVHKVCCFRATVKQLAIDLQEYI